MTINEQTAQLILDALAWCNKDWHEALEYTCEDSILVSMTRQDFVKFCKERGITGVNKSITVPRYTWAE